MIIRLRRWYIIDYILKYETGSLIMLYYYIYSGLLGTIEDVIQNSMEFMRNAESGSQVDG